MPGGVGRPGMEGIPACAGTTVGAGTISLRPRAHLLLLLEERLLLPELLLPDRLPALALARSLCARLFWVLALPPLLAAWARLLLLGDDEDDLEEEEELRDAIACSFGG